MQIFLRFPSLASLPLLEKQGMTAAYVADCRDLSPDEITAGYERFRRAGSPYPPSGPELRKHAMDARADRIAKERASQPKLAAPARGIDAIPPENREAEIARRKAVVAEIRRSIAEASMGAN